MKNSVWSKRLIHFSRFPMWVIGAVLLTSCASIFGDSGPQPVAIQSKPHGVPFDIVAEDGRVVSRGKTPMVVSLNRSTGYFQGSEYRVRFKTKNGTRTLATSRISASLSLWYLLGNISYVFFAPIGWFIVDPATGAMWVLDERVDFSLKGRSVSGQDGE